MSSEIIGIREQRNTKVHIKDNYCITMAYLLVPRSDARFASLKIPTVSLVT